MVKDFVAPCLEQYLVVSYPKLSFVASYPEQYFVAPHPGNILWQLIQTKKKIALDSEPDFEAPYPEQDFFAPYLD